MSDSDQQEKIDQFIGITGTDTNRAKFYLQSAAWDLNVAVGTFFEGSFIDDHGAAQVDAAAVETQSMASINSDVSMPSDPSRPTADRTGKINYVNLDSDESEDEGEAYYAGGSDRSGQQVLGPPRKKKSANKIVDSLFKSAKEAGAEERPSDAGPSSVSRPTFVGSGYRLGETNDDSTLVPGKSAPKAMEKKDKKLKLWKNGFSVDDGPLRDYNDPANKQFLDSIAKGEVPNELLREVRGGEINLDMEDKRAEEYIKPKVTVKAFSGAGNMLGSDDAPPSFSPTPNVITTSRVGGDQPAAQIQVDESKPTTSIQLRLADGKRMVLKLNHSHQVSDIRQHIVANNPQYAASSFCLMTTFPNKELSDETQSMSDANLLNAVVVQRLK